MDTKTMILVRDLATEYLDIEKQLGNYYLHHTVRTDYETRQKQILDTLRELHF